MRALPVGLIDKYDAVAERYSASDYADAEAYYARRAQVVIEHGPRLTPGASVLDIACGDGGLGRHLLARGYDYRGVDASERMVEVAQRALGDRVRLGTFEYEPPEHVEATTIFRSLYIVPDRRAFLARVRRFTTVKLVFDYDPRARDTDALLRDLADAGWGRVDLRPFLMPQRAKLPAPLQRFLFALEPVPGARLLTTIRFPVLVSAQA